MPDFAIFNAMKRIKGMVIYSTGLGEGIDYMRWWAQIDITLDRKN